MRSFSRLLPALWIFFSLPGPSQALDAVSDPPVPRPNILLIMSDDHAQRAISAYGADLAATPNLDRIASEGAIFRNSFVTNSICTPSRAVLLTGKFSHRNGVRGNGDVFDGHQATLPRILQQQGYETAVVGKWHLGSEPVGFDHWQVLTGQGDYYSPRFRASEGEVQYDGSYVTDKVTDLALEFLQNRDRKKPFMMLYHHKAPHRNWMPPVDELDPGNIVHVPLPDNFDDDYAGRPAAREADMRIADMFLSYDLKLRPDDYDTEAGTGGGRGQEGAATEALAAWHDAYARMTPAQQAAWDRFYDRVNAHYLQVKSDPGALARWMYQRYLHDYLATVRSVDGNIGRVLDYLDTESLYENTIVIYTSDQGFYLGEHGWYDKRFMYEESMRTPAADALSRRNRGRDTGRSTGSKPGSGPDPAGFLRHGDPRRHAGSVIKKTAERQPVRRLARRPVLSLLPVSRLAPCQSPLRHPYRYSQADTLLYPGSLGVIRPGAGSGGTAQPL